MKKTRDEEWSGREEREGGGMRHGRELRAITNCSRKLSHRHACCCCLLPGLFTKRKTMKQYMPCYAMPCHAMPPTL